VLSARQSDYAYHRSYTDYFADHIAESLAFRRSGQVGRILVSQPRDVSKKGHECWRRRGNEPRHRVGMTSGFQECFTQMNEVTLGAELARAPRIGLRDPGRTKRAGPGNHDVVRDDVPVLEREDVQGAEEFFELQNQRHGKRAPAPAVRQRQAFCQILERQPIDKRERVQDSRRHRRSVQSVGHDGSQPCAEHPTQLRREALQAGALLRDSATRFHLVIIRTRRLVLALAPGSWKLAIPS
jgi:hypothetical protein